MDIRDTKPSNDGRLLTLKMRDGRVLVNHLQGICRDMRWTGFSWVLHGGHDVCGNQTVIRVLQSGQTCILGRFVDAKPSVTETFLAALARAAAEAELTIGRRWRPLRDTTHDPITAARKQGPGRVGNPASAITLTVL
jgi:hypothetical protein